LFVEIETMTNSSTAVVTENVSPAELLRRFGEIKASQIVSLTLLAEVKMLKKHRTTKKPWMGGEVLKRTVLNGMFGTDYENAVKNRRVKEGDERDFEAALHQWADHVDGKPAIVANKAGNQWYANLRVLSVSSVEYLLDGVVVDEASLDLEGYGPKRGAEGAGQQVQEAVIWRTVKLAPACSFESIRTNGKELHVA
jgi:hypothetical protein